MKESFISIKKFSEEPYSSILGYPRSTSRQIKSRISELEKLKIKSIALYGPTTVGKLEILGKGYVGIVVLGKKGSKKVAVKIRRTDSIETGVTARGGGVSPGGPETPLDSGHSRLGGNRSWTIPPQIAGRSRESGDQRCGRHPGGVCHTGHLRIIERGGGPFQIQVSLSRHCRRHGGSHARYLCL